MPAGFSKAEGGQKETTGLRPGQQARAPQSDALKLADEPLSPQGWALCKGCPALGPGCASPCELFWRRFSVCQGPTGLWSVSRWFSKLDVSGARLRSRSSKVECTTWDSSRLLLREQLWLWGRFPLCPLWVGGFITKWCFSLSYPL